MEFSAFSCLDFLQTAFCSFLQTAAFSSFVCIQSRSIPRTHSSMYLAKIFGEAEAERRKEQLAKHSSVDPPEPSKPRRVRILGPARVEPQEPPSTPPPIRKTNLFDARPPSKAEGTVEEILAAVEQDKNPDVRHSTDGSLIKAPRLLTDEVIEKLEGTTSHACYVPD